jgi:hypothetical protein
MSNIHALHWVPRPTTAPAPVSSAPLGGASLSEFQEASNALSMATYYLRSGHLLGAQHKARLALVALHRLYSAGEATPAAGDTRTCARAGSVHRL